MYNYEFYKTEILNQKGRSLRGLVEPLLYLLLPLASTGHQCRRPGPSLPSPTSALSLPRRAAPCCVPGSSRPHVGPHGAPTPHSGHRPTAQKNTRIICNTINGKCICKARVHSNSHITQPLLCRLLRCFYLEMYFSLLWLFTIFKPFLFSTSFPYELNTASAVAHRL